MPLRWRNIYLDSKSREAKVLTQIMPFLDVAYDRWSIALVRPVPNHESGNAVCDAGLDRDRIKGSRTEFGADRLPIANLTPKSNAIQGI